MRKTLRILGMVLCSILLAVGLGACGGDNDDDVNQSIVGTWETVSNSTISQLTFKSNGSCAWREWESGRPDDVDTDSGTYKVDDNYLYIWWESESDEDGPWTATFSISGNKMTTSENGGTVWTRK